MGWDGTQCNPLQRNGMGSDGMGWDGMGHDIMPCDAILFAVVDMLLCVLQ